MKKYGIIDMGTNSIRLMLAKTEKNNILSSEKYLEMTRLGQGVDETKMLSEESMKNSIDAVLKFKEIATSFGVESLEIIATSAVRDALNKDVFVRDIKENTGIDVQVITGVEEAELGFGGVVSGVEVEGPILVIDIGGGSTELIIGTERQIEFSVSEDVGAVRMTGKHIDTDPILNTEIENLITDIDSILADSLEVIKKYRISKVVGIGGTITTISAIKQKLGKYDPKIIHNSELSIEEIYEILESLGVKNNEERKKVLGLAPKRADIIYAGITILKRILDKIEIKKIIISDYDNLEGYLFKKYLRV